jgi:hypothetical protein
MKDNPPNIKSLLEKLHDGNTDEVKHALEEIGRAGKGDREAVKALREFLRKERIMPLRILAAQTLSKVRETSQPAPQEFKKPGIFQCPESEKIKRIEIIDVTCPHCHKKGTASVAGFENEFPCESCGKMMQRDLPESCIEKCPVGSACVGKERYQKYLQGRNTSLNKNRQ